ncbi:ATP-binding protein [Kitasatospora sp. NPDC058965]|uniref:ATP-binding protein n=1 Tax=Kitasatospora sp. NPDC058965 TaxID=3346682 RepID=UPI00368A52A6
MPWIAQFPGAPETVGAARAMVRDALAGNPKMRDAELIASELVTNAIIHTRSGRGGHVWLEITRRKNWIRIAVTDDGAPESRFSFRSSDEVEDFGRGLAIVQALADYWGARSEVDNCHTVWAELTFTEHEDRQQPALRPEARGV